MAVTHHHPAPGVLELTLVDATGIAGDDATVKSDEGLLNGYRVVGLLVDYTAHTGATGMVLSLFFTAEQDSGATDYTYFLQDTSSDLNATWTMDLGAASGQVAVKLHGNQGTIPTATDLPARGVKVSYNPAGGTTADGTLKVIALCERIGLGV